MKIILLLNKKIKKTEIANMISETTKGYVKYPIKEVHINLNQEIEKYNDYIDQEIKKHTSNTMSIPTSKNKKQWDDFIKGQVNSALQTHYTMKDPQLSTINELSTEDSLDQIHPPKKKPTQSGYPQECRKYAQEMHKKYPSSSSGGSSCKDKKCPPNASKQKTITTGNEKTERYISECRKSAQEKVKNEKNNNGGTNAMKKGVKKNNELKKLLEIFKKIDNLTKNFD
ncbi:MAG: hypothetical protein ACO3K7_05150 [Candidatus Marinamargulisbacteria bacterium]